MSKKNLIDQIEKLNKELSASGFNIFSYSHFIEDYFTRLLDGQGLPSSDHADCLLQDGTRIEIKYSSLVVHHGYRLAHQYPYFKWAKIRGQNNSKDGYVDYILLIGYIDYEKHYDQLTQLQTILHKAQSHHWWFWYLPYAAVMQEVGRRNQIEKSLFGKSWIDSFFLGYDLEHLARVLTTK